MRLFIVLFLLCSVARAKDIEVYLIDMEELDRAAEKTLLVNAVKAHFGDTFSMTLVKKLYCSAVGKKKNETTGATEPLKYCTLESKQGTCTRAQLATAWKAGVKVAVDDITGDVVTYRRGWAPAEITAGARQDAIVAYFQEVHQNVTLQFMVDFSVEMDRDEKIQSRAVYLSVIDDLEVAQGLKDGTLLRKGPQ